MPSYGASWYPPFAVRRTMTPDTDPAGLERTFTQLEVFAHNGTHVDAPVHYIPGAATLDRIPLEVFVGPALIADLSGKGLRQPISGGDLEDSVGDRWRPGMRLLIRTDYHDRHFGDPDFWQKPPYLVESAARWMVERGVVLAGLDCLTEKPGDLQAPVHRTLLAAGIPILEYLRNLAAVPAGRPFQLAALPTRVDGVEAAPVRAVALLEDAAGEDA
ncbi:MAG: cyclase family protein [Bacillota bacterium]